MNKKTLSLTIEQYKEIIEYMRSGFSGHKPNERIAACLVLEASLGLRISDILQLKLNDIVQDGGRYRLDIIEKKTSKKRTFTVPIAIYNYIELYCYKHKIKPDERIFPITERAVQKQLSIVCDYLDLHGISTHSFRKMFATKIYNNSDHNIVLVQTLLQHSSPSTTRRYIGISDKQTEEALEKHISLLM